MLKRFTLIFILFFGLQITYAQNNTKITITFKNLTLKEALIKLEDKVDIPFYFQEKWLENITVDKSYNEAKLQSILNDLLEETTLNSIIYDKKIILTNNRVINDVLPYNYFIKDSIYTPTTNSKPLFYNPNSNKNITVIGKQLKQNNATSYILSGYVKNENTNQPIQNLVLSIQGKNLNTTTNSKGYYSFKVPYGVSVLVTKLLGYQGITKDIVVYNNGNLNLKVPEVPESLDEVIVNAKKDENIKSAALGVNKIDIVGIKTIPLVLGERDILKVATTLPGIKTAGEGAAGFNVRGGRTDQNLILLDNAVIYNPSHFLGFFSALNPFTTGSAEIYKGSIPADYGGRLSSVFDIKTKDGNNEKFAGEGSIGPITANLAVETPIIKGKSSIITGVRATYSDWVLKALDEETLKNSEASFYDGIVKYKHQLDKNNDLSVYGYYSYDNFSITSDSTFKYNNFAASVKWDHTFNDKNRSEIFIANSNYKYNIDYDASANTDFDYGYTINETHLKLNFKYLHSKKHKFDYGISSKLYNVNPGEISPKGSNSNITPITLDKERGLESALFISDKFTINKKLLLDVGLRYSFYAALGEATQNVYEADAPRNESTVTEVKNYGKNKFIETYGGPELRASFRYFLTPSLSLKGSFNNTIQYLHLLSNNTTESPTDTWKLSDLNISPQRANQFAIGLYKNIEDKNLEISLEGYYKKMNDILDYKVGANLTLNENLERELLQGQGKAYGIELLVKKAKGKFNGWLGYSYSRSFVKLDSEINEERVNNGKYFPANFDKPHDFTAIANYKLTHRYSFSANFTYQTGRPITYPVGKYYFAGEEQVVYSDRNKFRIPDYYRLDLGVNIEGNHKIQKLAHSFWNISVYNVLGRNNPYSVFFVNENGNVQAYKTSIFSIPIPTITYNFKF